MLQVDEANCAGNSNCRIGKMVFSWFFFFSGVQNHYQDQRIAAIKGICDR